MARWASGIGGLLLLAGAAHAVTIDRMTPQGEVARVRQVVVTFSAPVLPFGDLRQADPITLTCSGAAPAGSGRWASDRQWLYDFSRAPGPGVRCTAALRGDWKPALAAAGAVTGNTTFAFQTGGPAVLSIQPSPGSEIEEEQHFLIELSGAARADSVTPNAWCEAEHLGERLPLRLVGGTARDAVLKSRGIDPQRSPPKDAARDAERAARLLVAACARPLPPDVAVRLVWGAGIAAHADRQVLTRTPQPFAYRVRKPFSAEFSCERERANAPCLPIRPLVLRFSSPVPRALAAQVLLRPAAGAALPPVFEKDDRSEEVSELVLARRLPENAAFTVVLPPALRDASGRTLANADAFPLGVRTGDAPPIAKFATAPFGIVERFAESADAAQPALLPLTLRHVQGDLRPRAAGGQVRVKRLQTDADILAWLARLRRYHESTLSAEEAGLPRRDWFTVETETDARGRPVQRRVERRVATRELPLLAGDAGVRRLELPQLQGGDPRPFEVIGIPLAEPGYQVVEIESARLGAALLDKRAPMYVRTGVLVTNLGVHFKHGRESSLAWITSLDRGRPVEGADVAVSDCTGRRLWAGRTDARGIAAIAQPLESAVRQCPPGVDEGLFVSARKADAPGGVVDTAFVFGGWQKGIEPWRFNLPSGGIGSEATTIAHTVFDRTLLRAGETVSMKHFVRTETAAGLAALPSAALPARARIVHQGSGQQFVLQLAWNGSRSATSSWAIPAAARLGVYDVFLEHEEAAAAGARRPRVSSWISGEFRVEEFRVPLVDARLAAPKQVPFAPTELALAVQLNAMSGGGMAQLPARLSALLKPSSPSFAGYDEFSFEPPREPGRPDRPDAEAAEPADAESAEPAESAGHGRIVADKLPLSTDRHGAATVSLKNLPPITRASELQAELSFNDPNGEVQTVQTRVPLWPSAVVLGVRADRWTGGRGAAAFSVVALDTAGRPLKGQAVAVQARLAQTISTRKRIVGGFYAYDNRTEQKPLGSVCSGRTDERGLLACEATFDQGGQIELIAEASDGAGRVARAAASLWVTGRGELWFEQDNDDRIDVLPEKKRYEPGQTARLQVRMPFREATALVAVEREGVIDTRVVTLRGDNPTIELPIAAAWAPNVYVSVLALRGRVREVPWYSLFTWGWRAPLDWWHAWRFEGPAHRPPTALVDLARPAFKFGVAALQVGLAAHQLDVTVAADKPQYAVRQTARVRVKVTQGGRPAAGAEVAFAAVDEGLLALRDNRSWDLLHALLRERAWGVETSTAQSEIIGRRHYGRKALAPGGGGGRGGTRELFDTLLLWRPQVTLDAQGEAVLDVPLNDSLTSFRFVAVADAGVQAFGSGSTSVRVTQDLQLLAGLPPLVRDSDLFSALLTLRNTTAREMKVHATLAGSAQLGGDGARVPIALAAQDVLLPAGAARELAWPVQVPAGAARIEWQAAAGTAAGSAASASDRVKLVQRVSPALPVRVLQATLAQLDGTYRLPVAAPADAVPADGTRLGGLVVAVQPALGGALPGLRRFFETYPFACLEQQVSKAIGLKDAALWAAVAGALPTYLDRDGLASYFPPRADDAPGGSDRLTAYLIAASHEAGFALPDAARESMLAGLTAFVEGRIERRFWSPRADLDVRKLAALEALSRHGRAQPRQLGSINLTPNQWPTAALIDWLNILRRVDGVPERAARLDEAQQVLRSRLTYAGTTLAFSTEDSDFWWWLMDSGDANAARLILAVVDDPAWRNELPKLVLGSLGRQRGGAWLTTTANLWGSLALDKFAARFEAVKPAGTTLASAGGRPLAIDWSRQPAGGAVTLPWPAAPATLTVTQQGAGRPWLSVQSLAAVPLKGPLRAGYSITRTVSAVERKDPAAWSRGDVLRVRLEVDAQADMTWVVVSDPVPGGATLLGSGLGRDSAIATRAEQREGRAWPAFEERSFEAFRSYFAHLPRGRQVIEYTLRLNNPGRFALPPTRVEAMYAPDSFGEAPNAPLEVAP